jgi:hypothetical protein
MTPEYNPDQQGVFSNEVILTSRTLRLCVPARFLYGSLTGAVAGVSYAVVRGATVTNDAGGYNIPIVRRGTE